MSKILKSDRLIHVSTGTYPLTLRTVAQRHPNISFSSEVNVEFLRALGYEKVTLTPRPEGHYVNELPPIHLNGAWTQQWEVREPTPEEYAVLLDSAKADLRRQLNTLIETEEAVGFPFEHQGQTYHIQVRTVDRINILSRVTMANQAKAAGLTTPMSFRPYENVSLTLSPDELINMGDQAAAAVETFYHNSWAVGDAITQATTFEELPSIPETLF